MALMRAMFDQVVNERFPIAGAPATTAAPAVASTLAGGPQADLGNTPVAKNTRGRKAATKANKVSAPPPQAPAAAPIINTMPAVQFSAAAATSLMAPLPPPALATTQLPPTHSHAAVSDTVRRQVSTSFTKKQRKHEDSEESSSDEEEDKQPETPPRRKRAKKQGKSDHWPNMHVYSVAGQKVEYEELSWQQFFNGYLTTVRLAAPADQQHMYAHLGLITEDLLSYSFQAVRSYHGVWLQEIEQGKVQWADNTARDVLRRRYIWTPAPQQQAYSATPTRGKKMATRGKGKGLHIDFSKNQPCAAYQSGECEQSSDHNKVDHICKYCLLKLGRRARHPMQECRSMPDNDSPGF
jgi:hypothetical protein